MAMLPSLKSALIVGVLACAATTSPVSRLPLSRPVHTLNDTRSTVYPMPTYVTMTKRLTVVVENSPVDCAHGPLPTLPPAPACNFDHALIPLTSTRYYCGGLMAPQTSVLEEMGEDVFHEGDAYEEDADEDSDEEDVYERDEDEDDEEEEDDEDDEVDEVDGDNLDDRSEPGYFRHEHFERQNSDCTTQRMVNPVLDFGGTSTAYTTTSTVTQLVNCGRCTAVTTVTFPSPGYKPVPLPTYTTTVTAIQPSTTTRLECEPQPTRDVPFAEFAEREIVDVGGVPYPVATHITKVDPWPPALTLYTDFPKGRDEVECALFYNLFPSRLGSVRKVYTATRTTTAHKDCGPCALVWGTAAYPFPVGPLPTTKTKKGKTTVTAMACRTHGKG
ncbi:hypothetical protein V8C34DRAFT_319391 [Trichoderma compactum]